MKWGSVLRLTDSTERENAVQWYFPTYGPGSSASEACQKFAKNEKFQIFPLWIMESDSLGVGLKDIRLFIYSPRT